MDVLKSRKKQLSLSISIYLTLIFLRLVFLFLSSYYVENLTSEQVFKFFMIPVFILFVITCFLLVIFFMDYSKEKFVEIPKWWFLFYLSLFIPGGRYIIPLLLFCIYLGEKIPIKTKRIIVVLNFLPWIFNWVIKYFIFKVLINQISDKVLLMGLYYFVNELIKWVLGLMIIKLLIESDNENVTA